MNKELKEKIAVNAANEWCRCFKCDGRVNATGCACEKDKRLTCHKWYDGYRTALLALEDDRVLDSLWKPADGDDLPEYDREVIVLINYNAQLNIHDEEYPTYRVGFGHRPNPDGWDGKNIDTNEVTHYTPKLYDKGGWNAPYIAYWLDVKLPKEIEP
jgi:hypothetical protein